MYRPGFHPQSLLVIEEYDKADCATRAMLRQLLDRGQSANGSFRRSVVVLEANTGFFHVHRLLAAAGGRRRAPFEAAHNVLKDIVAEKWAGDACESPEDRAKLLSLIDAFVPFLPLEAAHVRTLLVRELRRRAADYVRRGELSALEWTDGVVDALLATARPCTHASSLSLAATPVCFAHASLSPMRERERRDLCLCVRVRLGSSRRAPPVPWQVSFEGQYAMEGAKEARTVSLARSRVPFPSPSECDPRYR